MPQVLRMTKWPMKACVQAVRPPSGGGPGERSEALERAVRVWKSVGRAVLGLRWDGWVGRRDISCCSSCWDWDWDPGIVVAVVVLVVLGRGGASIAAYDNAS